MKIFYVQLYMESTFTCNLGSTLSRQLDCQSNCLAVHDPAQTIRKKGRRGKHLQTHPGRSWPAKILHLGPRDLSQASLYVTRALIRSSPRSCSRRQNLLHNGKKKSSEFCSNKSYSTLE